MNNLFLSRIVRTVSGPAKIVDSSVLLILLGSALIGTGLIAAISFKYLPDRSGSLPMGASPEFPPALNIAASVGPPSQSISTSAKNHPALPAQSLWVALPPHRAKTMTPNHPELFSNVLVKREDGILHFRVLIGPYDPSTDEALKQSPGHIILAFQQGNGKSVLSHPDGIKIPLQAFEAVAQNGTPIGWIFPGEIPGDFPEEHPAASFSLAWTIPDTLDPFRDPIRSVSGFSAF